MKLLVLGGTWFVGRAVVEEALDRGWSVTTFNRGRSGDPLPGVQAVHGDRERPDDLRRLAAAGPWDVVVDVHGTQPAVVRDAAQALRDVVGIYAFVSTVSAYKDWPHEPVAEDSELHDADPDWDPGFRHWDAKLYGPLKAGCEAAIGRAFEPDRVLTVRPSVVLGRYEYVGRMRSWLDRCRRGGQILLPGRPERTIQPVDVRDVSSFMLDRLAAGASGAYNVAAPQDRDTYGDLIRACAAAVDTTPELVWVDEQWLVDHDVRQWTELPLWRIPSGTWALHTDRAMAAGLTCRPLAATVADAARWLADGGRAVKHERDAEHGIEPGKEQRLLTLAADAGVVMAVEHV